MRHIFIISIFCFLIAYSVSIDALEVETVKKTVQDAPNKHEVSFNVTNYDAVAVTSFTAQYVKKNLFGEADLLYIKGIVRNFSGSFLSDVTIGSVFYNKHGDIINETDTICSPRIIRVKGSEEGRFTVYVPYDPEIVSVSMDITWAGKKAG